MMGGLSPLHWIIIIGALLLLLGGGGKISGLMGDAAKGIKAFRDGMKDEPDKPVEPTKLSAPASADAPVTQREDTKS
jgi:sec-independent protein translocase protein TatA